jgi:hypothetical protein
VNITESDREFAREIIDCDGPYRALQLIVEGVSLRDNR